MKVAEGNFEAFAQFQHLKAFSAPPSASCSLARWSLLLAASPRWESVSQPTAAVSWRHRPWKRFLAPWWFWATLWEREVQRPIWLHLVGERCMRCWLGAANKTRKLHKKSAQKQNNFMSFEAQTFSAVGWASESESAAADSSDENGIFRLAAALCNLRDTY